MRSSLPRAAAPLLMLAISLFALVLSPSGPHLLAQITPDLFAQAPQSTTADYPPDLSNDIVWAAGFGSLDDVQRAFNSARSQENALLNTFMPELSLPAASTWAAMDDNAKALWLINAEREARGLLPLQDVEKNAQAVAQSYAAYLLAHNAFAHDADGNTQWERLHANPAIGACHDFLGVAENLYYQGTTATDEIPFIVEQAIYSWLYADKDSQWLHRRTLLWKSFTNNAAPADNEGLIGLGRARGAYTSPFTGKQYPNTEMIVLNLFDPCATWQHAAPPTVEPPPAPVVPPPPVKPATRSVSGITRLPVWVTLENQPFEPAIWPSTKWVVSDRDGSTNGEYHWIPATCRVYNGQYSAMGAGGGADGMQTACADEYPNNVRSWMVYGPFNLTDAVAAELRAKVWVYTEPYNDMLCLVASTDRKVFNGPCVSGNSNGWVEELFDLNKVYRTGSLLGRSDLYVALVFITNDTDTRPHMGVYADDVVLRKAVLAAGASASGDTGDATTPLPLYGVQFFNSDGSVTTSDADGNFVIRNLPPGIHMLTPVREGYQFYPPSLTVDLRQGNVSGVEFVASSSPHYTLRLPLLRLPAAGMAATGMAATGTQPNTLQRIDASFELECGAQGCRLLGPRP